MQQYTANAAFLPAAVYEGRANLLQLGKNWFFSFFGNLVGCLIMVWLLDEVSPAIDFCCNSCQLRQLHAASIASYVKDKNCIELSD